MLWMSLLRLRLTASARTSSGRFAATSSIEEEV